MTLRERIDAAFPVEAETLISADAYSLILTDLELLIVDEDLHPVETAIAEYRRRLGGWQNLPSYAACLVAGRERQKNPVRIALPY